MTTGHPSIPATDILRHGLQVLAFCSVVAVFTSAIWPGTGYAVQWVHSVAIGMLTWVVIEFGRLLVPQQHCHRDPTGMGHGWPKGWRGVALTALGIGLGYFGGTRLARSLLGEPAPSPQHDLTLGLLVTIAAGVVASFYFFTRGRQAALQGRIATAERDASQARLALLQSQLEPHMLFNTLANLRALIAVDPPAAQQMLDRLDGYLRATLGASRATTHPLADEFALLSDYLELMAVRMGPRLRHALELPEALRALPVPTLLLQPLVENAIRHGLEPLVEGGSVRVSAATRVTPAGVEQLTLQVCNTGAPPPGGMLCAGAPPDNGFGLAQVRERLRTLHGDAASFELSTDQAGQTRATITLPLR